MTDCITDSLAITPSGTNIVRRVERARHCVREHRCTSLADYECIQLVWEG